MDIIRFNKPASELNYDEMTRNIWGFIEVKLILSCFWLQSKQTIIPKKDRAEESALQQARPSFHDTSCMRSILLLKNFLPNLTISTQQSAIALQD